MIIHFVAYLLNELNESDTYSCHLILYYYLVCLLILHFSLSLTALCLFCDCQCSKAPCIKTLFTNRNDQRVVKFVSKAALSPTYVVCCSCSWFRVCVCFSSSFLFYFPFFNSSFLVVNSSHAIQTTPDSWHSTRQSAFFLLCFWWICSAEKRIHLKNAQKRTAHTSTHLRGDRKNVTRMKGNDDDGIRVSWRQLRWNTNHFTRVSFLWQCSCSSSTFMPTYSFSLLQRRNYWTNCV